MRLKRVQINKCYHMLNVPSDVNNLCGGGLRKIPYLRCCRGEKVREHPELNQGLLDLQSNALPLSYIPADVNDAFTDQ